MNNQNISIDEGLLVGFELLKRFQSSDLKFKVRVDTIQSLLQQGLKFTVSGKDKVGFFVYRHLTKPVFVVDSNLNLDKNYLFTSDNTNQLFDYLVKQMNSVVNNGYLIERHSE